MKINKNNPKSKATWKLHTFKMFNEYNSMQFNWTLVDFVIFSFILFFHLNNHNNMQQIH